jgi:formylglycine-generating enzyme required for sulfatase activity
VPELRNSADPRLVQLLAELPGFGVPVQPDDYARIGAVLPPTRTPGPQTFEHTLTALLAKDAGQRRILAREIARRFRADFEAAEAEAAAAHSPTTRTREGDRNASGADSTAIDLEAHDDTLAVDPEIRPRVFRNALLIVLGALALIGVLAAVSLPPGPSPESPGKPAPPITTLEQAKPQPLPEVPIDTFNTWVPVVERASSAPPAPWWSAALLIPVSVAGLGWLVARGRDLSCPPTAADRYRLIPGTRQRRLLWSADDHRLPPPLDRAQRRELVWGVQHFTEDRPTRTIDLPATVDASARLARLEVRFAAARRLREVWLWRDQRPDDDQADALIDQVHRELTRAGILPRHGQFTGVPDPVRVDVDPEGRGRTRGRRVATPDLDGEAREALVAILTDGRGLTSALQAGGASATQARRALQALRSWPRCCLVDCSDTPRGLSRLAARFGLVCIRPEQLTAWLAERPAVAPAEAAGIAPDTDALLWAACQVLPAPPLSATGAQALALRDRLGLPSTWRLPSRDAAPAGFDADERHDLLRRLGRQVWQGGAEGDWRQRLDEALDFWDDTLMRLAETRGALAGTGPGPAWQDGLADHRLRLECACLALWCRADARAADGRPRLAAAVKDLYDLDRLYAEHATQPDAETRRADLRQRLAELSAIDLAGIPAPHGPPDSTAPGDGRILLPWRTIDLPELPGEAAGTTLARLFALGFAGAEPARERSGLKLGIEQHLARGLLGGIALASLLALAWQPALPVPQIREVWDRRIDAEAKALFRTLSDGPRFVTTQGEQRLVVASRKVAEAWPARPGDRFTVHWCWTGAEPPGTGNDSPCRALWQAPDHWTRHNALSTPSGVRHDGTDSTVLLRAGSLAEPIRACADDWPGLSVAVIAADAWPPADEDPGDSAPARRLAIQLLDNGAVDLAIIGPDWAREARALAEHWSFVADSQWLFFTRSGHEQENATARSFLAAKPALGKHQGRLVADYDALAELIAKRRARPQDPIESDRAAWSRALGAAAGGLQVAGPGSGIATGIFASITGNPRLWVRPPVATRRLSGGVPMDFVQVCPGTFTMGATGLAARRVPALIAGVLGVSTKYIGPETDLKKLILSALKRDSGVAQDQAVTSYRNRIRKALDEAFGVSVSDADWQAAGDVRALIDRYTGVIETPDERPAHPVLLKGFGIARTETTRAQLGAIKPDAEASLDRSKLPAASLDWQASREVCKAIAADLPSEAQWEYAARGGSRTAWSWGDDASVAGDYAWFSGNSDNRSQAVGQKASNPLGLSDMHGNLWEWALDCYDGNAYTKAQDRLGVGSPADSPACRLRVLRGGAFDHEPRDLRSAVRYRLEPEYRFNVLGFRCVRSGAPGP